nr:unnamed protein product [Spirometra erinaceieuropaei]
MFQEGNSCVRFMALVEQWMTYADKDKPPCPFNRRRRPPQTIFFVFGKDKDQNRWSVLRFDPHLEKEERIADMEKREWASYSVVGESIFVVGGNTAQASNSTSVEEFLVAERRWRKRASLAVGRSYHAAAVLTEAGGETLIGVFGGYNGSRLSSCEVYEVGRDRWFKLPDLREKRDEPAAACLPGDSRIFVFGGHNGSSVLASVEFCHLRADWRERATSSDFWQPAAPMRTARSKLAATHFRAKIIVAGGYGVGGKSLNVVEMFTLPDARCPRGQWTELTGMKEPRAFFALLTSTDDAMFALGCWNGSGNTVETFTAPGGPADVSNDLTSWSWSSKKPLETLEKIAGAASIRILAATAALNYANPSPMLNVATGDPDGGVELLSFSGCKLNIALWSLPAHHLHFNNELAQRLDNLQIANSAAAATVEENASVENCWDTIQSKALAVLGRASRHLQPALREGPPAKSLHRPPHRRRQQMPSTA